MRDSSWDNRGSPGNGRGRPWLKWVLLGVGLAIGIPLLLTATFGGMALRNRAKLWPLVRAVHARLQTDEGAKDLFAKNPALADSYANGEDFLEAVRSWRNKVGELPVQEPVEGPTYSPNVNPGEVAASIQGAGGAWMMVDIRGGGPGGPVQGEGIIRIFFGEDRKALRAARKNANTFRRQREWDDFRNLMLQCGDDRSALALYHRESGLRARYPSETAFLESVKVLRPALAKLPAKPQEGVNEFSIHSFHSPFSSSRVLTFTDTDGLELAATWRGDQLSNLELRPSNRHR